MKMDRGKPLHGRSAGSRRPGPFLAAGLAVLAAAFTAVPAEEEKGKAAVLLKDIAAAAEDGDWRGLYDLFFRAHLDRGLTERGRRLFYEGALAAVENLSSEGDASQAEEAPLMWAYLAGKYSGLSMRHLYVAESVRVPPVGWGAGLAFESTAAYFFTGKLCGFERSDPARLGVPPAEWATRRHVLYLVMFAAALRFWLGLDAAGSAETAAVLDEWLYTLEKNGMTLTLDYLRDLATSPGLRDASVPGDAPLFYRFTRKVEDRLIAVLKKRPSAMVMMAAAERYAYPNGFRWLEPMGLSLEHLVQAGGVKALPAIGEQLEALRKAASNGDGARR